MEAFQVANPPILQSELDYDLLPMVADDILSKTAAGHVRGCPRDLARLQVMLFLLDDPLLQKTAVEFKFIAAKAGRCAENAKQPGR